MILSFFIKFRTGFNKFLSLKNTIVAYKLVCQSRQKYSVHVQEINLQPSFTYTQVMQYGLFHGHLKSLTDKGETDGPSSSK